MTYTLAYSPCPNDTYIFGALTNGLLDGAPEVRAHLADIEELNEAAARGEFALTKVSYGAIPFLMDRYRILSSGGAIGRGCGPLLVARPAQSPPLFSEFARKRIAIPGERTTAFMLLQLALGTRPKSVQMRFDQIVAAVANGRVDARADHSRVAFHLSRRWSDCNRRSRRMVGEHDALADPTRCDPGAQRRRRR